MGNVAGFDEKEVSAMREKIKTPPHPQFNTLV
jgi:hypothetical protein